MDYVRPNGSTVKKITYNEYIYNFDHLRLPPPRKPECGTSCNRKYHVVQTDRTRTAADSHQKQDCQQQDLHLNTFFKDFELKELGFFLTNIYL